MTGVLVWRGWHPDDYKPQFERNYLGLWVPVKWQRAEQSLLYGKPVTWSDDLVQGNPDDIQIGGTECYPFTLTPTDRPGWFRAKFTTTMEDDE